MVCHLIAGSPSMSQASIAIATPHVNAALFIRCRTGSNVVLGTTAHRARLTVDRGDGQQCFELGERNPRRRVRAVEMRTHVELCPVAVLHVA